MPRPDDTPVQPPLEDLMARYLRRSAAAQAAGLASAEIGEVVPFEAAPVQVVDPRLAWDEALAALGQFRPTTATGSLHAPPDWPALVSTQEPTVALAFCVGNYPQMVRHLQPLLHGGTLSRFGPSAGRPVPANELLTWAAEVGRGKSWPQLLLAVGALRLARQFDAAAALLEANRRGAPPEWQAALANEEAALVWHRGEVKRASALWEQQAESVPVLFNRGMAALFLERPAEARASLGQVVAKLPDSSAWYHLGRLYLTLAETR